MWAISTTAEGAPETKLPYPPVAIVDTLPPPEVRDTPETISHVRYLCRPSPVSSTKRRPVRQLATRLEQFADGFRGQGDGVAAAHN
jgi:hypothetical protein